MRNTLLQPDRLTPPDPNTSQPSPLGEGVLDTATFQAIEGEKLFAAMDHTQTLIGRAALHRALCQPPADFAEARARQDATREIMENSELRGALERLVQNARDQEDEFYALLYGTFLGQFGSPQEPLERKGYGHETYVTGTAFLLDFAEGLAALPAPRGTHLGALFAHLAAFHASRAADLMRGPAYWSERGMLSAREKGWFTPAVRFTPTLFKPVLLTLGVFMGWAVLETLPFLIDLASLLPPALWMFAAPFALLYFPIVGGFDRDNCILPLRAIFRKSPELLDAADALGEIDLILSHIRYGESVAGPVTLPTLLDSPQHALDLRAARNPVLERSLPDYVPNDLALSDIQLTFITGPNSGGKTALCKTVAQIQVLGQMGCPVPATSARMSVADHIFYQIPDAGSLIDGEGRFGTELKRTKDIFLATTPASLVILDELSEGTTWEERMEISQHILEGFEHKGNSTVLITHNHELVDLFQKRHIGQARQVEFVGEHPTHRLIPGISRVSHAHRIAKKLGFSKEDIARHLRKD